MEIPKNENPFADWWTTGQVARALGVSSQSVHYLMRNGRFRYVRMPLGWLFDPASVEEHMIG